MAGDDIPATAEREAGLPALLPPTAQLQRPRQLRSDQPEQTVDGEAFGADLGTSSVVDYTKT